MVGGIPVLLIVPALCASRIIFFLRWETKHRTRIMWDSLIGTRLYSVPKRTMR